MSITSKKVTDSKNTNANLNVLFFTTVLESYHDKQQLTNEQFFDFLVTIHQTLNEALGGEERFDELLKYIESQQPQVKFPNHIESHCTSILSDQSK